MLYGYQGKYLKLFHNIRGVADLKLSRNIGGVGDLKLSRKGYIRNKLVFEVNICRT